ncbi:non-ribosomal peptide synthetase [Kitasatospora sp. CB01950]|uniref:non-ribosomal peptide synthetase n=1 Tax=Kitasatospora sp. CB01950 TaxID=1703930 RepID=UPI00093EFD36|nr:non-ribosomal peptide synthetase [Kitasatospora sp. CB01950]OKJ09237.1 tyrocidine synthase 3 [Kitasatospora sp. CB01950]
MTDTLDTKLAALQSKLAALPAERRAAYERLLKERAEAGTVFPLSVTQQGIWFFEQLRPGNLAYTILGAVRLRGALDTAVLRSAAAEVVRRHESLRTVFELRDGRPVQVVRPELPLDFAELPAAEGQPLEDAIAAAVEGPFDLAAGPLLRLRVLHLGPQDQVLAVAMHHLVSDGWSMGLLITELGTLYEAFGAGRPSPLPGLPIQYGDFAAWQQKQAGAAGRADHLAHWREHLAGAPAQLTLPTDRPRPPVQGFNGASCPVELERPLMAELAALGRADGATTYMVLLALFHVLLHRWSGQRDVVVGVPTAGRERAELEPLIGFFVNTLPVRVDLAGDPSFRTALGRVREACLGLYAHQDVPFERLVEELRPERDLSRPPIFQSCFSYQDDPVAARRIGGLRLERLELPAQGARFDLEFQSFARDGALSGWFEYDRDLFEPDTMARMARHFRRLAELVVAAPDTPVAELELLDADERRQVLAAGNDTARTWPGVGWIHEVFQQQAHRTPDAEALRFEGESIDYAELNRRANRLAHTLIRLGTGPDTLVGVAMERSIELVVALLAVLKAGGAYVALDPGQPAQRLAGMLEDAPVPVLLTQRHVRDRLPDTGSATVLLVEDHAAGGTDTDPNVELSGEHAAYVIFTSGSTGRPKGVVNVHAGIRNRLLWMQDAYRLDGTDRVLQKTPFSFDVSVWEFFWPLMAGATLVVARPDGHRDPQYLVRTIREEAVTTAHFVPSMLQAFVQEPGVEECTALRRVMCSGEALPRSLQDRFFARSGAELHNLYGPTEAAVDVTAWACRRDDDPRPVPIGHPIANTRMYVLDRALRPVPSGVAGELHIAGDNLARGYLGDPGRTAERFVPDPFDPAPGARLYKTGDLARLRSDGAIEYLGRLDHQVKLRGLRIELGEIESVLTGHPQVREAVVTARRQAAGDVRLVAHLTAEGDAPATGGLISFLKERLPEYMVPSAFMVLDAFPLTVSGKTDRRALPEPPADRPELASSYTAPGAGLEETLAGLWRELLGARRVGRDDNFFDLGGHSLLMVELRARLARTGHELSMVELFQHPTVASLAGHLERSGRQDDSLLGAARDRAAIRRKRAAVRRGRSTPATDASDR